MAVFEAADLRTWGMAFPDSKIDYYQGVLDAALAAISSYLFGSLDGQLSATVTEYQDGTGLRRIILGRAPVVAVTGVKVDGNEIAPSGYRADLATGIITLKGDPSPEGVLDAVEVTYVAGWDEEDVPADIRSCIVMTVQNISRMHQAGMVGITSRTTDGGTESIEQTVIPFAVQSHLDRYRMNRGL